MAHPAAKLGRYRWAAVAVMAFGLGCGGSSGTGPTPPPPPPPPPPPAPVATVTVSPDTTVLVPAATRQFAATAKDASGNPLSGRAITWSVSPGTVATVSTDGAVTAVVAGSAVLTAQSEGKSGTATVTVLDGKSIGATGGLVARPDSTAILQIPAGALTQTATITIAAVASPPASPRLIAGTAFEFGPTGTTFSQPVTVRLKYSAAAAVSADPALFRLHRYSGTAWQEVAGSTVDLLKREITGQTSSFSQYAIVSLPPPSVATVSLSPDSSDVQWRGTRPLAATTRDASGGTLNGRAVTWQSSDQTIATVDGAGIVTGVLPGKATITATSEGISATARIRVVPADLTRIVDSINSAFGLPAMGSAIVTRAGVMAIGVAGTRRVGGGPPVTVDDTWHIGSNTKAITAFVAAMAVEAGVITWNRTVEQAFPASVSGMRAEHKPITLLDLVNHSSGVVNDITGLPATQDPVAGRDIWSDWTLKRAGAVARGTFYYSNNGFAMAGAMIERAWGSTYESILATRLFQPLGIVGAGWGPTTAAGNTDQPIGHSPSGANWVPCDGCDNRPGLSAAGTLHIPLQGWARIIHELMRADAGQSTLLSQAAARELSAPGTVINGTQTYSHGWVVSPGRIIGHDGSNTTNRSRVVIYLDAGVAYLITTNAGDPQPSGGTPVAALNALQRRLQTFRQTGQ